MAVEGTTQSTSIVSATELIETLYSKPKTSVVQWLSNRSSSFSIPSNLFFPEKKKQIFYLSLLLHQSYDRQTESKLMSTTYSTYSGDRDTKTFLKYCMWKFSKESLRTFIQSHICDIKSIKPFVGFLAPKLAPNVIDIWFENDFEFIDELYSRMNRMEVSKNTPFNDRIFSHLLPLKAFKKAVFNANLGKNFVIEMKGYANRGDFNYFYDKSGISRSLDISCQKKPRDELEFSFFRDFDPDRSGDIVKIHRYQQIIGNNFILSLFIDENIAEICKAAKDSDMALEIINGAILYNSSIMKESNIREAEQIQKEYRRAKNTNDLAFDLLKKEEKLLKACISSFYDPKDKILRNLLVGEFNFTISEASEYINLGYEEELISYFKTKAVADLLGIIDEWNSEFFTKLFSEMALDVESAVILLDFIQRPHLFFKREGVAKIYDQIMKISDKRIFERIDPALKHIYVIRNGEYRFDFLCDLLTNPHDVLASAVAYEIFKIDPDVKSRVLEVFRNKSIPVSEEISLTDDFLFDMNDVINSQFTCSIVLRSDAFCFFTYYFDSFIEKTMKILSKENVISLHETKYDFRRYTVTSEDGVGAGHSIEKPTGISTDNGVNRIRLYMSNEIKFGTIEKISFVMNYNLSNKYVLYVVFDSLLELLTNGNSVEKIFVLTYLKPAILTKYHIIRFTNTLIPLLNSSNVTVCKLSKIKFNEIRVENKEIQNILPYIVQAFLDRDYFREFVSIFQAIQFNNYLCFNSLNLLLQLFLRNLDQYPSECFDILKRLINIIKDKDIQYISGLIFKHICLFVTNNNHSTAEALEVASQFCLNTTISDFEVLIGSLSSLRIANFLVNVLKVKGDSELNNAIISQVLSKAKDGASFVDPPFIAAGCELSEFSEYLNEFIPLLKILFMSNKIETRQVACKALKSITQSQGLDEYKEVIGVFLIESCMHSDYFIRLQSLDITTHLPIIFILRHDQHSLVKKKALDVWKQLVPHTNKELKRIFTDIMDFIKYCDNKTILPALKEVVAEFSIKYINYLEAYIASDAVSNSIKEFIYIEAVKNNRLNTQATEFCKYNFCPMLFSLLSKNHRLRDDIIGSIDQSLLYDLCAEDNDLSFYLFNKTANPIYIDFVSHTQKLELIKKHFDDYRKVGPGDENMILILQTVESSAIIEDLMIHIDPTFSYYYISVHRTNYGKLPFIFEKVFNVCAQLDELISPWNLRYIKGCSFDRINNKTALLLLLIPMYEKPYFDRAIELIRELDYTHLEDETLFELLGYLFRNLLLINRRLQSAECLKAIYNSESRRMGYFNILVENTVMFVIRK